LFSALKTKSIPSYVPGWHKLLKALNWKQSRADWFGSRHNSNIYDVL